MSATLDQRTIKRRAALLEQWCEELVQGYLHERRVELPRLERHAIEALDRSQERFPGEHRIARSVLDVDIPRKEKFLDAALLILQNADYKERALFILRPEERQLRAGRVLNAGGLVSDSGKWVNF